MMSGDRSDGGYTSYTTRVPYELSTLTKKVFDQLAEGTTGEKLAKMLEDSSESALLTFQKDLSVVLEQDYASGNKDLTDTLNMLRQMASAELDSRRPGPKLFKQFMGLLAKGTTLDEIQGLLQGASPEALRELPNHLDRMQSELRSSQPDQAQELEPLLDIVKQIANQIVVHH